MIKRIPQFIYGILGAVLLLGGVVLILKPAITFPREIAFIASPNLIVADTVVHLAQELGVTLVGISTILLWATFNVEKVGSLIYAFLLFAMLFGGIHWMEYFEGNRKILSPLINSLPFVLLSIAFLFQRKNQG